ncbi:hemin-degrading factor [Pseudobacteriovorax antillogorgiicola]|uniref:Putative hemin transport protein n=1 Tax=Pseudobacteriovorax antillogorgiicola TaxID=1513793 RepID=A0A1Y6CH31_9BACT|nr:ChuX/HutX family heme-like substrate-binding protein [Pseudobacteriovorax antillogorgiicola]TCS49025.1 putative hemin transport protein [Pseudobacteriovorax antillogorgiicola]SMF52854.1 putative hemin transport protein [Pseudobacteriovorax antillogorgiicola]
MTHVAEEIKNRWQEFSSQNPKVRIFDAAKQLEVSEEQLLLIDENQSVIPLVADMPRILKSIRSLGKVMALTRNPSCVIETKGVYDKLEFHGPMGLALNPGIDLRLFLRNWRHAYAVESRKQDRTLRSIQFFNRFGEAVHKIYALDQEQQQAFEQISQDLRDDRDFGFVLVESKPEAQSSKPYDKKLFLEEWAQLKDTHEFFQLLKRHGLLRVDAMKAAEGTYTERLPLSALEVLFQRVVEQQQDFMAFVGNDDMIQIFTGKAQTYRKMGSWLNFLDREFNLHFNAQDVGSVYKVTKPSVDGDITSLEIYSHEGQLICQFFGERKPGQPELESWRNLLATVAAQ